MGGQPNREACRRLQDKGREEQKSPSGQYLLGKVGFKDILTKNRKMRDCLASARKLAEAKSFEANVLILGESGTGKTLLAQAIHTASPRCNSKFVAVNVGAIPDSVLSADLFGSEPGAFTGAESRAGFFEEAHGGTLFLDEIGNLNPAGQAALLDVVEHKSVTRLGSSEQRPCDFRLITATNTDIETAIQDGSFRQDLYWRIARLEITLPPLRERHEDITWLAGFFLARACKQMERQVGGFTDECLALMQDYSWPGNVRELRNCVERALYHCTGDTIDTDHMFPDLVGTSRPSSDHPLDLSLEASERRHIVRVLTLTGWNMTRTAEILGISRSALYDKIRKHRLERPVDES
jgi:transcriptional regulator with PAS, ATPase and Fis domain